MGALERILSGEFVDPGTPFGFIFYALVFLGLAWLSLRSLRLTLDRRKGACWTTRRSNFCSTWGTPSFGHLP